MQLKARRGLDWEQRSIRWLIGAGANSDAKDGTRIAERGSDVVCERGVCPTSCAVAVADEV